MIVLGAIAATWVDMRMYVPADQAVAPAGLTYPMIGTLDLSMELMMLNVASRVPPGVSMARISGLDDADAVATASLTASAVTDEIVPLT